MGTVPDGRFHPAPRHSNPVMVLCNTTSKSTTGEIADATEHPVLYHLKHHRQHPSKNHQPPKATVCHAYIRPTLNTLSKSSAPTHAHFPSHLHPASHTHTLPRKLALSTIFSCGTRKHCVKTHNRRYLSYIQHLNILVFFTHHRFTFTLPPSQKAHLTTPKRKCSLASTNFEN